MSPEFVLKLSKYPNFPKVAEDLIRIVGLAAAAILMTAWGGQEYPVPKVVGGGNKMGASRYGRIVELIGEPAAVALVREYGGERVAIPSLKSVKWSFIQETIREDYDQLIASGLSSPDAVFELGVRYGVSGRAVEKIIKRCISFTATSSQSVESSQHHGASV
ncbi:Mor transcription activator family protein [Dechloromonas denitrificans]|uniref:Mor transcription activator family protein n=1 Tax=Dechloromonas denitrificans TaxID=281362 RepID=UPI001CFA9F2D|nr:Mor transcription activator family protein [Dechloromonas denitrificans]UCV08466.1 hypothetical protein KI615_02740 [Dechloromonas denitrificans]